MAQPTTERRWGQVIPTARQFWSEVTDADLQGAAGEIAFNLVLAIFPALILFASLAAAIGPWLGIDNLFQRMLLLMGRYLPPDALQAIVGPLTEALAMRSTELASLGVLFVIWAASNGTAVIIKSFNRVYGVRETRPFWFVRLVLAIGLTFVLFALLVAIFVFLVYGEPIATAAIAFLGLDPTWVRWWAVVVWPIGGLAMVVALDLFYWLGPNVRRPFRLFSPGAMLAAVAWLIFSLGFRIFVALFSDFPATYGAIAGVIVLMLWLNNSALLILLGAKVNAFRYYRSLQQPAVTLAPPPSAASPVAPAAVSATAGTRAWRREQRNLIAAALGLWTCIILIGSLRGGRSRE